MKFMNQYNRPLVSYEGSVSIEDKGVYIRGYFEAVQIPEGTIAIGCYFPESSPVVEPGNVNEDTFEAQDNDGWLLTAEGTIICPSWTLGSSGIRAVLNPTRLRAQQIPSKELEYLSVKFTVANLLWGSANAKRPPRPVKLCIRGFTVTITPLDSYPQLAAQLQAVPGIEQTCHVEIRKPDGERLSLKEAEELMGDLVSVLRLWSGVKLDWLYGEGLGDDGTTAVERIHKNSVTGNFHNTIPGMGWTVDLPQMVEAFFSGVDRPIDFKTMKSLIDYFVDVCNQGQYLELRALSAATLLDTITAKYAVYRHSEEVMPKQDFQEHVLPALRKSIEALEIEAETREQLINNVQGGFRTSFRNRVKLLSEGLNLGIKGKFRNRVIDARNSLVHEGRFPNEDPDSRWQDYRGILWTNFAALCRIIGYEGALPVKPK